MAGADLDLSDLVNLIRLDATASGQICHLDQADLQHAAQYGRDRREKQD